MRHDGIDLLAFPVENREESLQERFHQHGGLFEDGRTAHIEHVHLWRSRGIVGMMERAAAEYLRQVGAAAIGFKQRVPDGAGLARLAARENGGGGGITEQHGALAFSRVEGAGSDLATANQDVAIGSGSDEMSGGMQREQEAQTGGVDIEAGANAFRRSQCALQESGRAGNGRFLDRKSTRLNSCHVAISYA